MKRQRVNIVSCLFLMLYFVAVMRPYAPYVDYFLNKEKITEEKCINKDKPLLECDGKCYLKSQVISAQEEEKKSEQSSLPKIEFDKYPVAIVFAATENNRFTSSENTHEQFPEEFSILERDVCVVVPPPRSLS